MPAESTVRYGVPHGYWHDTVIDAMRDGSTSAMAIEGNTDTEVFRTYVRDVLLRPEDLVIMDNLAPHKNEQTIAFTQYS